MLLCLLAISGWAEAATSYADFARHATISSPALSPDGKHLAVSLHNSAKDAKGSDYQLVVFSLPDLKPVSRLNMAPHHLPARVVWTSNKRIAVSIAYESGSREQPLLTGEIIALDYDGQRKSTIYSRRSTHSASMIADSRNSLPNGFASIDSVPAVLDESLYVSVHQGAKRWADGKSMIYRVNSRTGSATLVGEIARGGMRFTVQDDVARYAVGEDDNLEQVVFRRDSANQDWTELPREATGKRLVPLQLTEDGKGMYALSSQAGEPDALVLASLDGGSRKVLASDQFASVSDVFWTPEPRRPYAAVIRGGRPRVVYLENNVYAQVHSSLSKALPHHFVSFIGSSADGSRLLTLAASDKDPGTVALFDTGKMNLTSLYRVLPWIEADEMSERRPIRFTNRDGMELDGFLTLPKAAQGSGPLVLIPHGGPIGPSDEWEFEPDAQFLASRGYAVLQVNYRGSGGRGWTFERSGYKQFATGIQHDLVDAVKWAVSRDHADPDRVCVYGASFGGYSALMAPITDPGMFKCAIDYVGISDYQIWFDRSDTRRFAGGRSYFEEAIGTDSETIKAVSPIYHLDKFNIPVFIVHGEDDQRVPVENAERLRSELQKTGKPFEWMVKPKEGHGFYSEENRAELYERMEAFLDEHIGTE